MSDLSLLPTKLVDMSVAQIAALPHADLQEGLINLQTLQSSVKAVMQRFHAALDQRYADQAMAARQASGKDFGVCHLSDGPLQVTVDTPKRVGWDQAQLAEIAQRIAAAGDKVGDYIDIDFSVSESRFTAWPPALKEQITPARIVKPGKTSYRLALINSTGV